jgi:ABC-type Mn2+/Zn2+ transport system permease subunit
MVVGVLIFSRRWAHRRLPPDAVIGVFYSLATALGILLIAKSAQGESHMLTLLRGDILAVDPHETFEMFVVFAVVGVIHALFGKEFLLVSLDRDTASTLRFNAAFWDFLLFLTIGVAVSLSIRSVGVLLTSTMLIVPAATAFLLVPRWKIAAFLAPLLGVVAVAIGLWLSLVGDFPASAVIVAVSFALMAPGLFWHSFVRRS